MLIYGEWKLSLKIDQEKLQLFNLTYMFFWQYERLDSILHIVQKINNFFCIMMRTFIVYSADNSLPNVICNIDLFGLVFL